MMTVSYAHVMPKLDRDSQKRMHASLSDDCSAMYNNNIGRLNVELPMLSCHMALQCQSNGSLTPITDRSVVTSVVTYEG